MSKAILVLGSMPECCLDCPICVRYYSTSCCGASDDKIINYPYRARPDWCPLFEAPDRANYSGHPHDEYGDGYADGWNDCLDEILV